MRTIQLAVAESLDSKFKQRIHKLTHSNEPFCISDPDTLTTKSLETTHVNGRETTTTTVDSSTQSISSRVYDLVFKCHDAKKLGFTTLLVQPSIYGQ